MIADGVPVEILPGPGERKREDWRGKIGEDANRLARGLDLLQAIAIGKVVPVGINPEDQRFQLAMGDGQKDSIRTELLAEIEAVIADLQALVDDIRAGLV